MEDFRNIIVMGASAGGFTAIKKVISGLPANLDAVVMIVLHVARTSNSEIIAHGFQKHAPFKCAVATPDQPLQKGRLYVAQPDHHLMLKDGAIFITQGAHENKYRPSIDVLFRSAAVNFGNKVIGIVLSGLLEDGTAGMAAIKRCGGTCIIQDPSEAEFSDMPRSVLNNIHVDYNLPLDGIAPSIEKIVSGPLPPEMPVPVELQIENEITENMMSDIDQLKKIADRSDFVCPDCGGGLWSVKDDPAHRYRCHTGHVYAEHLLHEIQDDNIEQSLFVSIRMLEEKANMLKLMATRDNQNIEDKVVHAGLQRRMSDTERHIQSLKSLLLKLKQTG